MPRVLVPIVFIAILSLPFESTVSSEKSVMEDRALPQQRLNLEDWGIYNGCISSHRIRKINVLDSYSAILMLVDGKQVKMRFKGRCEGIRQNGFVYTAKNNLFCTQSYSVRVLNTGTYCQVDSLQPLLQYEELQHE